MSDDVSALDRHFSFYTPLPPAEQRQVLAADERKRAFHEEKRNEFESFAEEEHDGTETRDISDPLGENHPLTHCS